MGNSHELGEDNVEENKDASTTTTVNGPLPKTNEFDAEITRSPEKRLEKYKNTYAFVRRRLSGCSKDIAQKISKNNQIQDNTLLAENVTSPDKNINLISGTPVQLADTVINIMTQMMPPEDGSSSSINTSCENATKSSAQGENKSSDGKELSSHENGLTVSFDIKQRADIKKRADIKNRADVFKILVQPKQSKDKHQKYNENIQTHEFRKYFERMSDSNEDASPSGTDIQNENKSSDKSDNEEAEEERPELAGFNHPAVSTPLTNTSADTEQTTEFINQCSALESKGNIAIDLMKVDFVPCQIFDVNSLCYCTYCFTADHEDIHKETSCCLTDCPPHYWPSSWDTVKILSYKHNACIFNDCKFSFERASDLQEHLCNDHATDWNTSSSGDIPPEDTTEVVDSYPTTSTYCLQLPNENEMPDSAVKPLLNQPQASAPMSDDMQLTDGDCFTEFDDEPLRSNAESSIEMGPGVTTETEISIPENDTKTEYSHGKSKFPGFKREQDGPHYRCGLCYVVTSDLNLITQHYVRVHEISRLLICKPCYFISPRPSSLSKHWGRFHRKTDEKPKYQYFVEDKSIDISVLMNMTVPETPKVEEPPSDLDHNEQNHTLFLLNNLAKYSIECTICDYNSSWFTGIQRHYEVKHWTAISETMVDMSADTTTYRCVTCKTVEVSRRKIALHYVKKHVTVPVVQCELCELTFADISKLKCHMRSEKHKEFYRRSIRCTKCLFATLSKKQLMKHALEHAPSFKCSECDFVTKVRSALSSHVALVHSIKKLKRADGLYHCKECEFSSKNKANMAHHHRITHGINNKNTIPCELCDFVAANSMGYITHIKSHRAETEVLDI